MYSLQLKAYVAETFTKNARLFNLFIRHKYQLHARKSLDKSCVLLVVELYYLYKRHYIISTCQQFL
jgi:hypothetical protein